ncbi:MAG TPA: M23 family metallopeptidase [bacterium]|nr:M23 family metallopeptidase [bacterium]
MRFLIAIFIAFTILHNCAVSRGGINYKIKPGDTLKSIADKYNVSVDELAKINKISNPAKIYAGNILYIPPVKKKKTQISEIVKTDKNDESNKAIAVQQPQQPSSAAPSKKNKEPYAKQNANIDNTLIKKNKPKDFNFDWPVYGKIIAHFSTLTRGITIEVEDSAPVKASADGVVIYSAPLKGYGNTIIIKHTEKYLTVYTYLKENKINIDQQVKKNEVIGIAGISSESGFDKPIVHFEIRVTENGAPIAVDPIVYLD